MVILYQQRVGTIAIYFSRFIIMSAIIEPDFFLLFFIASKLLPGIVSTFVQVGMIALSNKAIWIQTSSITRPFIFFLCPNSPVAKSSSPTLFLSYMRVRVSCAAVISFCLFR